MQNWKQNVRKDAFFLIHGTESVDTWRWRVLSRTYDLILRFPNMKQIALLTDTDAW